ncbi:hypothetical protein FQN51_001568 [Onygenales sp. PD_10]|nr:hypothetical protein FQN51_001568 [Onygenales sp. PD_10]
MAVAWQVLFALLILVGELIRRLVKLSQPRIRYATEDFDLEKLSRYPIPQIKGKEKYRTTMGLKRLDQRNWLTIDKNYMEEHKLRDSLFRNQRSKVFHCAPESHHACEETLQVVTTYLCKRYPAMFKLDGNTVKITKTSEEFHLKDPTKAMEPLEIAARLAMEDLSVLLENDKGEMYLAATASLFPIGWCAKDRIGYTISQMHGPVPLWHKEVEFSVNKLVPLALIFLSRLSVDTPMERSSYFIQVAAPGEPLDSILFKPAGFSYDNTEPQPENIIVRRERQTFLRLPESGAIVFGVKTTLTYLPELDLEELNNLAKEVRSWPDSVAKYKGRDQWGAVALGYTEARAASKTA